MNSEKNSRYFFKMFKFIWPYRFRYFPGIILYTSQGFIFPLVNSIFLSGLTAAILTQNIGGVWNAVFVMLGMFAGLIVFVGFGLYSFMKCALLGARELRKQLFNKFVTENLESSMAKHSGEGIASINTDARVAASAFDWTGITNFLFPFQAIVMSSIVVFAIDWRLGLASLGAGGLALLIQTRFVKPLAKIGKERLEANAESVKAMSNIFSGGLAARAFNLQNKALVSFDAENNKLKILGFKQAFISMWQNLFTTVQGWLTLIIVYAFGGWLVATGELDFAALMMAPAMCMAVAEGMSQIGGAWAGLQAPAAAAKRVFAVLDAPVCENTASRREYTSTEGYAISLRDVNFSYFGTETNALEGVSLEIKENEMVALVGASGSGKSTLLRVITGLFDRADMDVRLGNMDLRDVKLDSWRRKFAYVDQSCKLFDMSVEENIALGAGGSATAELVRESAVRASADGFISALPEGYASSCGEKGASLSGGQKQRIAIARALCRKAPVLVFDEATSALDAESERYIMETIEGLRKDHTILITTHNLHNITTADKIIVMDGGKVTEIGTHEELMAQKTLYSALFAKEQKTVGRDSG